MNNLNNTNKLELNLKKRVVGSIEVAQLEQEKKTLFLMAKFKKVKCNGIIKNHSKVIQGTK